MKVNQIGAKGLNLIKKYEGFKSAPYKCPAGIPTIGYGATYYPNGAKVKLTDKPVTQKEADTMLLNMLKHYEQGVDSFTTDKVNQNQFDALVSIGYNIGLQALKGSTLIRKVNLDPNDKTIKNEFMRWTKANGKVMDGLLNRRKEEAELYGTIC
jgi:lysozyme